MKVNSRKALPLRVPSPRRAAYPRIIAFSARGLTPTDSLLPSPRCFSRDSLDRQCFETRSDRVRDEREAAPPTTTFSLGSCRIYVETGFSLRQYFVSLLIVRNAFIPAITLLNSLQFARIKLHTIFVLRFTYCIGIINMSSIPI